MKVALAKYYQENSSELYCTTCTSTSLTSTSTWMATSCTQPTNLNLSISFWFSLVHLTQIQCLLCPSIFFWHFVKILFARLLVGWIPLMAKPIRRQLSGCAITIYDRALRHKSRVNYQLSGSLLPPLQPKGKPDFHGKCKFLSYFPGDNNAIVAAEYPFSSNVL